MGKSNKKQKGKKGSNHKTSGSANGKNGYH
ncbi:UNVERIFIED_ORG: hypothetical protein ABIC97_002546 [Peribacillus simplex]